MKRTNAQALTDAFTQFQNELQRLALQIVDEVMRREAERAQARAPKRKPALPTKGEGKRGRKAAANRKEKPGRKPRRGRAMSDEQQQLELSMIASDEAAHEAASAAASDAAVEQATAPAAPAPTGKRRQWTRENIVEELANWLVNGNAVDASFVTRHGPPGLAAAARRIFGRFDAALNVAGLHVAKLYPDGPPPKRGAAAAAAAAVSRKQASAAAAPKAEEAAS